MKQVPLKHPGQREDKSGWSRAPVREAENELGCHMGPRETETTISF